MTKRLIAIILIFLSASAAWGVLGVLTEVRTRSSSARLEGAVGGLWGTEHQQLAPGVYAVLPAALAPEVVQDDTQHDSPSPPAAATDSGGPTVVRVPVGLASTRVEVKFDLEYRRKGLLWFSTYNVDFAGRWTATNSYPEAHDFVFDFRFPTSQAIYDDFRFQVNDREVQPLRGPGGSLQATVNLGPGQAASFAASYRSRGLDRWSYQFGRDVTQVRDFTLTMDTDFKAIDFPSRSISPTSKQETPDGWRLIWRHDNLVSGFQIGLEMPHRLNPGPLASRISFFAPIPLLFFFLAIFVLGVLRGVNLHPMHYFLLAAAFFSFHLLFAYLVDHLDLNLSFAIAALTSVGLVVSYLRLVAGNRFAFVEAGLAQLLYLVLFSYTLFLTGFTGLTVTVGAIVTLFVLMQMTARLDWDRVFGAPAGTAPGGTVPRGTDPGGSTRGGTPA